MQASPSTAAETTTYPASVTSAAFSAAPTYAIDPSEEDYYNFALNVDSIALGITIAGVLPVVFFLSRLVVLLYRWCEWRKRKRMRRNTYRKDRRRDVEAVDPWAKPELSARQARYEMGGAVKRFEMDGGGGRVELPADGGSGGARRACNRQELRGEEFSTELMCEKTAGQLEVLILT